MLTAELKRMKEGKISFWAAISGLFLSLACVIYFPAISGGWFLDDYHSIVLNDGIKDFIVSLESLLSLRGVSLLSFAVDYSLWGLNPSLSRAVNVFIHLCNSLLVVALCRAILSNKCTRIPLAVGLIFLCHPVQTSAVSYIVQRMTLLSTFFVLCSLLLLFRYFNSVGTGARSVRVYWLLGAVLAGVLSVFSKESTILLPCLVPFVAWMIGRNRLQDGWQVAMVAYSVVPLAAVLTHFLSINEGIAPLGSSAVFFRDVGPQLYAVVENYDYLSIRYLLSQGEVSWVYLKLVFLPLQQALDYCWPIPDMELRLLPVFTMTMLGGVWVVLYKQRDRYPLSFFGFHWVLFFTAVESSIIPLDPIFEHRLYLLMIGISLVAVEQVLTRIENRTVLICIALLTLGGYVSLSWQRNTVWGGDEGTFWDTNIAAAKRAPRPLSWRGVIHFKDKEFAESAAIFQRLIKKGNRLAYLRATGEALYFAGKEKEAFDVFTRLGAEFSGENSMEVFSAYSAARKGHWPLMEELLEKSQSKDQSDMRVPLLRATIAEEQGNDLNVAISSQKVINHWESMAVLGAESLNAIGFVEWARTLRSQALFRLSDWLSEQSQSIAENPEDINAMVDFAGRLLMLGEFEQAKEYYLMASAMVPKAWNLYYNLGIVSDHQMDFDSAADYYDKARKLSPRNLLVLENLAAVALKLRQYKKAESLYREITSSWPSNGKAWLALGGIQELTQRYADAKLSYEVAARLPNYSFKAQRGLAGLRDKNTK